MYSVTVRYPIYGDESGEDGHRNGQSFIGRGGSQISLSYGVGTVISMKSHVRLFRRQSTKCTD